MTVFIEDIVNEHHTLKIENGRMRAALEKIRRAYVDAPGTAAPTPTSELIWEMYSAAGEGLAVSNGE
jgi:hypothetical protein